MIRIFAHSITKKFQLLGLIILFSGKFVLAQTPVINSFSPTSGLVGSTVTITGSGFAPVAGNNVVFFGATMATVLSASSTSLTVTLPIGATYEPISVLNGNSALVGYSAKPFLTTFTPNKGNITKDDFSPPVAFSTGGNCTGIVIGDIDGDGKPDLIMANTGNLAISVLRNTSTNGSITAASFAPKIDFAAAGAIYQIAIGDLDGDGKPDVAVTNNGGSGNIGVSVYRNTSSPGSVSFAPRVDLDDINSPVGIAIADLDGDGKPEIAVADKNNYSASIWQNSSTRGSITAASFGTRTQLATKTIFASGHTSIAISDLDGDGKPDIVVNNPEANTVSVFRNNLTNGFFNTLQPFDPSIEFRTGSVSGDDPIVVKIGDMDGDGKPDIVTSNYDSNSISVLRNTSVPGSITASSFAPKVDFAAFRPWGIALGDLDGDGKPDLAIAEDNNLVAIFRNTSVSGSVTTSSFAPRVEFADGHISEFIAMGDLDGDGKADLAVNSFTSGTANNNSIYVLRNNPFFPPNTQATNIVFTNTAANSTTATWTNGNGPARAVFISIAPSGSPLPAGSTTYNANPVFGLGTQIGSSGWYCIYNGTGNTVDITGLSSGATYRVMVVEYNGAAGAENYLTSTATGNPGTVTTVAGGSIAVNSINRVTSELTNSGTVQYAATFATAVTGLTASDFALATMGSISGASITSLTGSGSNYTITVNTGTGDGTIGLNLASSAGLTPGIITPLPFIGQTYTLDRTPPAISISNPSDSAVLSTKGPVTYKVTYSDLNFNSSTLTASNVTLNHGGSATGTISVSGSDTSYTVTVSNINGSGSLGISIAAGTAIDSAGNATATAGPSKTFLITPVLAGLTASSGALSPVFADTTMNYTAVVSNAVNTITITPTLTDPNATVTVNSASPSTPVNLAIGLNIIPVTVTTSDGKSATTYTVGIVRAAAAATGKAPDISYSNGNIVIANNQPFSVNPTNKGGAVPQTRYGQVTLFAGSASETPGYVNDIGNQAQFNYVQQAVMDAAGNLYVADGFNNAIREITPTGVVTTFAGSATGAADFKDGTGLAARFSFPDGIALDGAGNLFVSDYTNNAIRKINPLGIVTTLYRAPGPFGPGGMSIDASGNIIVAAQDASQIIKITSAGVATIVAGSTMGYANGVSLTAQFNTPGDVQPDTLGNLYVADFNNSAIRKITPAGQVTTIAGGDAPAATAGFKDGAGTATLFNYPPGLYVAPGGVIYVADMLNNDIRRIMPDGTINLIAGSANQAPGDADGIGTAAGFNEPDYIYIDDTGTAYVSEIGGNRIRKLVLTGYTLKGTLPAGLSFDPTTGIISGTPAIPFTATTDTVTAFNAFGYSTKIIHISYQPPSTIATLSNLVPSAGTLNPAFASSTTSYTDAVSNATTRITLTPTTTDSTATVTVNGTAVASGAASASIPLAVGPNTITTVVTAQDGVTTDTYTVIVTRAALSTVATLDNLTISNGTLTPAFASGTTSYTASVPNSVMAITETPTFTDPNATITVNGTPVVSGIASGNIPLTVGPNTITTVVTAQDGTTTDTYTVVVTRAPSSVATLANLTISQGTLTPAFDPVTTAYTASVPNSVTAITETPTFTDPNVTITVNGTPVTSGTASGNIPLAVGPNTITTVVTAQDGTTTDTYTVVVTRAPSSVATLANLAISQGTLTPAFDPATTGYTASVPNSVTNITETPTFTDPNATITVNGTPVVSGTASGNILLTVGPNTIITIVTAQDGTTTNTYTVVITRAPSAVATLANLTISNGTLTPAFAPATTGYSASVSNTTANVSVTPTTSDVNATVTVNGTPVSSGTASAPIALNIGPNTITTVVTAQDGTTTNTYTVVVTRVAGSDATLANLTINPGTLAPSFISGTTSYTATVSNSTTNISVTPTASAANSTITVNGIPVTSGTASAPIALSIGPNTITTVVTAQDGTTSKTYLVTVTRAANSDATLLNLTVSQGALAPAFNSGTTAYADNVSNTVTSITVTPTTSDNTATFTVNGKAVTSGTASEAIPLAAGENTITVIVTAQDGVTTKNYTITIYRGEDMASINTTNIITPNGDGKNDYWLIKDIGLYPQNNVTVYDKAGRVVYARHGYNNEWDGTLNGAPLAEGTYYYVVDLGPDLRKFKGFISIVRH